MSSRPVRPQGTQGNSPTSLTPASRSGANSPAPQSQTVHQQVQSQMTAEDWRQRREEWRQRDAQLDAEMRELEDIILDGLTALRDFPQTFKSCHEKHCTNCHDLQKRSTNLEDDSGQQTSNPEQPSDNTPQPPEIQNPGEAQVEGNDAAGIRVPRPRTRVLSQAEIEEQQSFRQSRESDELMEVVSRMAPVIQAWKDRTRGRLNEVDGRARQANGRVDQLNERVEEVNGRVDDVEKRVDDVTERVDNHDQRFQEMDEFLNNEMQQINDRFQNHEGDLAQIGEHVNNQAQGLKEIEGRVGQLDNTIIQHAAALESHTTNHREMNDKVGQIENTLDQHDAQLETHKNQNEVHRGELVELRHGMDTLRQDQRITKIQHDLDVGKLQNKPDAPKDTGGIPVDKLIAGGAGLAVFGAAAGLILWLFTKPKKEKDKQKDKQNDKKSDRGRVHAREWNPESELVDY